MLFLNFLNINKYSRWNKLLKKNNIQSLLNLASEILKDDPNFVFETDGQNSILFNTFFESGLTKENKVAIYERITQYVDIQTLLNYKFNEFEPSITFEQLLYLEPTLSLVLEHAILSRQTSPLKEDKDFGGYLGYACFYEDNLDGAFSIKRTVPSFFTMVNKDGNNVITLALLYGNENFLLLFDNDSNFLYSLNGKGQTQIEYVLFELGKRLGTYYTEQDLTVCRNVQRTMTRYNYNINFKYSDHSPILIRAVSEKNINLFKMICEKFIADMNITYQGYHLLDYVSLFCDVEILDYIINNPRYSHITYKNKKHKVHEFYTNFLSPCVMGKIEDPKQNIIYIDTAIKALNIDVNEKNHLGNTLLHSLCHDFQNNPHGKFEIMRHLIEKHNANPFEKNKLGISPIEYLIDFNDYYSTLSQYSKFFQEKTK